VKCNDENVLYHTVHGNDKHYNVYICFAKLINQIKSNQFTSGSGP